MIIRTQIRFALTTLIAAALLAPASYALKLEEIVVTAQKRAESAQDVPLSVTAVSGETLRALNINGPGRLELLTPGLNWGNSSGARAWPSLRGVNTNNGEANGEPALAYHIDGLYRSRTSQANQPLVDVERVEVLRGPQGIIFGRNSTGGAINVITRLPSTERLEYGLEGGYGRFNEARVDGFLNLPLSGNTAARAGFRWHDADGYMENAGPGNDLNDEGLFYGRALLKHEREAWDVVFRLNLLSRDRNGSGGFTPIVLGQSYNPATRSRRVDGQAIFINPRVRDGIADIGGQDIGVPVSADVFRINNDTQATEKTDSLDISLEVNYDFNGFGLKSISGWSKFENQPLADNDFTAVSARTKNRDVSGLTAELHSFQQEIQLVSNDPDARLEWLLGAFYFYEDLSEAFSVKRLTGQTFPAPRGGRTTFVFDRRTQTLLSSYAVFGQLSWRFTDQFQVTGGARHTMDDKDYTLFELGFLGTRGFNPDLNLERRFNKTTWRIGGEYFINDATLAYASYSTGFRSGGFNRIKDNPDTVINETVFEPETISAWEAGLKMDGLFNDRFRLNLAAFFQEISDQQISTVLSVAGTGQAGFFNAGETEIYGFEADFLANPTDPWYLAGTLAWINAEYKQFLSPGFAGDSGLLNLAGNKAPRVPTLKATLSTGYEIPLRDMGRLIPSASVVASGAYFNTQFNTHIDRQPAYVRTDLRLRFESADDRWFAEAFVENLTNEKINSYGIFGGSNAYFANFDPPRTFGVRFGYQN